MFLLQIKRTEGIEINSSGPSGEAQGVQWGSSSCIVRAKKRVTSCAYFFVLSSLCGFFVSRFVCLFVFSAILFIVFRLWPVYIEYTSAAAAFSFFPPVCSGHCDGMCVCMGGSVCVCV